MPCYEPFTMARCQMTAACVAVFSVGLLRCGSGVHEGAPTSSPTSSGGVDAASGESNASSVAGGSAGASAGASSAGTSGSDDGGIGAQNGDAALLGIPPAVEAGAIAYDPCPSAGAPCIVMPMGDSITWGFASSDGSGYRGPLFQTAIQAGQSLTFVGSGTPSGPGTIDGVSFPQANEGFPGYVIATGGGRMGLQSFAQMDIQTYQPQIVALMIGTNDVDIQYDLADAPTRLATLVDTILNADPNLVLFVAQIIPTGTDSENTLVQAYNAAIPSMVQTRQQAGKHIQMVDMYDPFVANPNYQTALMADNLHPNDTGYELMASVWYAAFGAYFH